LQQQKQKGYQDEKAALELLEKRRNALAAESKAARESETFHRCMQQQKERREADWTRWHGHTDCTDEN
jgi:hypothetical protein